MSKSVITGRAAPKAPRRRSNPCYDALAQPRWHGATKGGFVTRRARLSTFVVCAALVVTGLGVSYPLTLRAQPARPNIVLIFPDNLGWGEVGAYGSVRGPLTPRIDKLAAEGLRLNNFNVEFSCVVSRAALMTGRYAIRTGATQRSGITLWEVTIAEALQSVGYATALYGKWHLGGDRPDGREPSGRDLTSTTAFRGPVTRRRRPSRTARRRQIPRSSGRAKPASLARNVKPFNLETRRTIDRESAERSVAFMERNAKARKPFFLYYPMTQIHFPTLAHPEFAGKSRSGGPRRRDGRDGCERRPRARRDRQAGHHPQHHRAVVHGQRSRGDGVRGVALPARGQASTTA